MQNKEIIIKLTNEHNFRDMIFMCLENNIDFSKWYNKISIHAPECTVDYSMLEEEISFYHIYPDDVNLFFWINNDKNEPIKLTGVVNFYKYFYKIFKIETETYVFEVKAHKPLNDKCFKNWYLSTDEYFSINYDIHGKLYRKDNKKTHYFANGDELTENEIHQYLLNKKLNKLNNKKTEPKKFPKAPKPKPETKPQDFTYFTINKNDPTLIAC